MTKHIIIPTLSIFLESKTAYATSLFVEKTEKKRIFRKPEEVVTYIFRYGDAHHQGKFSDSNGLKMKKRWATITKAISSKRESK